MSQKVFVTFLMKFIFLFKNDVFRTFFTWNSNLYWCPTLGCHRSENIPKIILNTPQGSQKVSNTFLEILIFWPQNHLKTTFSLFFHEKKKHFSGNFQNLGYFHFQNRFYQKILPETYPNLYQMSSMGPNLTKIKYHGHWKHLDPHFIFFPEKKTFLRISRPR